MELKKAIFSKIDEIAPPHAIIGTNSSSIPVSKLEDSVKRKDKLLNLHFYPLPTYPMADIQRSFSGRVHGMRSRGKRKSRKPAKKQ